MVRIGVVGCARILPAHLRGLSELRAHGFADWRITALCSRQVDDALMFRQRGMGPAPRPSVISKSVHDPLNAPHMYVSDLHPDFSPDVFADWREMLTRGNVDAVLVLAPLHLHHQVALDCLAAGKHVLVEKPFAISVRAGLRMIAEAERHNLILGVAENFRYTERNRIARWVLDHGDIGTIQMWLSGGMGAPDWSPDVIVAKTPWRHQKLKAGGGPAVDGGVHLFDQIRYLCGEITEISAMTATVEPRRVIRNAGGEIIESVENEVEDSYFAHLRFASGAIGMVFGGVAGHGEPTRLEGGSVIYGTKGCLKGEEVVLDDGQRYSAAGLFEREAGTHIKERFFPHGVRDAFALEMLTFLRSIESGMPMETSGEEGLKDLACAFGVLESALLRRPVTIADVLAGKVDAYQREIDKAYGLLSTRST